MDWLLTKTEAAPAGDRPGGLAVVEPALAVKSGQTDAAPFYACGRPQLRGVDVQYDSGGFLDLTDLAQLHIVGKSRHPVARAREGTEVDRKSTRLNSSHGYISSTLFFFNDTATTEIYPLSLHDALPIFLI